MGKKDAPFNNPFAAHKAALKKVVKNNKAPPPPPPKPEPVAPPVLDDAALFLQEMAGAAPISGRNQRVKPKLPPDNARHVPTVSEEAEVLAELADLVAGDGRFDISDTDEFIEGCIQGLDRRILRRLRRGDFSFQSHIDLHGLRKDEAKEAVFKFIEEKRRGGQRCVLIVHGRGLGSKDQVPVLKSNLAVWLHRGRIARSVLAFCTARPHDGGAGAMYVLLRR